jgi:hypothetical protein
MLAETTCGWFLLALRNERERVRSAHSSEPATLYAENLQKRANARR